ncbi:MAG: 4-hydroxy-3-methylbut-2-enyl diphosphate reductase [Pseudomonadales bacterium]|jgi:4-hydroxy-3-methylbut-2-enyl diphosphate reductase|nr:4-hydroxy-3-methylbut-2-enyl diphosphate reductase [Pseudomonadales bacterium]
MQTPSFAINLANPRGFCAGVDRAIDIVDRAIDLYGAPIYVRHEVVHNKYVVENLKRRGAIFVDELAAVPRQDGVHPAPIVVFSAHGVAREVKREAETLGLKVFDATCPLVTKVHMEVLRYSLSGHECILIGHANHPEVEGTMGQYDGSHGGRIYLVENAGDVEKLTIKNEARLAYVTQTTLSMDDTARIIDALVARFPKIRGPRKKDICYATQNRQDAVKQLALENSLVLVVGSPNSSNSNRLRELAKRSGCETYLIDKADEIDPRWLEGKHKVGVTAGASAPEILVREVIQRLITLGGLPPVEMQGVEEHMVFSMPRELRA